MPSESLGANLLELQALDLDIERAKQELAELPALKELAKKRKSHARLKAEAVKLMAQRKDAETDIADLDAEERACNEGVAAAQARPLDSSDYHQVQALEDELSTFAKRLDKAAHLRTDAQKRLDAARERERQVNDYIKRFEQSILSDAQAARDEATSIQERIAASGKDRERLAASLPALTLERYAVASKRFHGLAVESLEGSVPSVCRTTLQQASLDQLRRSQSDGVAECPYCHRIIVLNAERDA